MTFGVRTLAVLALSVAAALAVVIGTAFAATVVVSPSSMQGWAAYTYGSGMGEFVTGPGTAPTGAGSAHLSCGAASSAAADLYKYGYNGVKLGQFTSLSYYAYEPVTGPSINYLKLGLFVSTDVGVDLLNFVPGFQSQSVVPHVWQQWNAMSGQWRSTLFGGEPQPGVFAGGTIAEYLAFIAEYHPSVDPYVVDSPASPPDPGHGGIVLARACQADGAESYVDAFTIGINSVDTTYDFEPDAPTTPTSTFTPTTTPTATSTPTLTSTATSTATNTPVAPSVAGIAEQPDVAALPSAAASSSRNYSMYILGAACAVLAALAAGTWATWRRRKVR